MRKFFVAALSMTLFWTNTSTAAPQNVMKYDSQPYIQQQYEIIKGIFHDFEVSLNNKRDIKIIIPNHYGFVTGKWDLSRPVRDDLAALAKVLNKYNESNLTIIGHTDNVGTEKSNITLSEKRAMAVRDVLVKANVTSYRIKMIGEGEELPRCSNETAKGRECNRRVELVVTVEPYLY